MQQNKTEICILNLPLICCLQRNYDVIRNWERFETGPLTVCTKPHELAPGEAIE